MRRTYFIEYFLIPIIIASSVLLFLSPFHFYIFGQDSIPFFGTFSFYNNPLFTFNNGIEMTYFDLFMELLVFIFHNPIIAQDVAIFFASFLAVIGIFDLIDVLDFKFNRTSTLVGKIFASLFFLYNPFTLSVTWAHFAGWSFLILISPFIVSFFTETLYKGPNFKRFALTELLLFILAAGTNGSFLPFILIVMLVYLIYWLYLLIPLHKNKQSILFHLKKLAYFILFPVVGLLWDFIPIILLTSLPSPSTSSGLTNLFYSESETTPIFHVLSLLAYGWIYFVPSAYPWISYLSVLKIAGYSLLFIIPFSFLILSRPLRWFHQKKNSPEKKHKMLSMPSSVFPLATVAFLAIIFSTGSNPPFGPINHALFNIGGPFLFLANAYYFVGQFYVLFLAVLIGFLAGESINLIIDGSNAGKSNNIYNLTKKHIILHYRSFTVIFLLLIILGIFMFPFVTGDVYQSHGSNIDEVALDNGLLGLHNFLESKYSSPEYYTLLIPTSSLSGATYLLYNNGSTFADSRGLVASVDPYPLIWDNSSTAAIVMENYLSSGNFQNIAGVMEYLHIKYIIYTKQYDSETYFMTHSPDGNKYNMTLIYNHLLTAFGSPHVFGNYSIFTVPDVEPIMGLVQNPLFVNSSLQNYVNFLSMLNYSTLPKVQTNELENALLSSQVSNNSVSVIPFSSENTYEVPKSSLLLYNNGTLIPASTFSHTYKDGYLILSPQVISQKNNDTTFPTDMKLQNSTYYANSSANIKFPSNIPLSSYFNITFQMKNLTFNQRNYINFEIGNITVCIEFIDTSENGGHITDLQISANFPGHGYYAWNNFPVSGGKTILEVSSYQDYTLGLKVMEPQNYINNANANDPSNFIKNITFPDYYNLLLQTGNYPTYVYNFTLLKTLPVDFIVSENISNYFSRSNAKLSVSTYGDYSLSTNDVKENSYLYFFNPTGENGGPYSNTSSLNLEQINSSEPFEIFKVTGDYNNSIKLGIVFPGTTLTNIFFMVSLVEILILVSSVSLSYILNIFRQKKNKIGP